MPEHDRLVIAACIPIKGQEARWGSPNYLPLAPAFEETFCAIEPAMEIRIDFGHILLTVEIEKARLGHHCAPGFRQLIDKRWRT